MQANGPIGKPSEEKTANGEVRLIPTTPAGFGCPCHGGQYDTEGNRTAGPPVRALDRYEFAIHNGRLVLLSTFSVSHVDGTGAQAQIHKYKLAGPGQHVDGAGAVVLSHPAAAPLDGRAQTAHQGVRSAAGTSRWRSSIRSTGSRSARVSSAASSTSSSATSRRDTNWMQTLGSATLTAFLVQAVTGVILAMYYQPTPHGRVPVDLRTSPTT